MKDAAVRKIKQEIAIKKKHIEVYNSYMRMAVERRDLHGVMDVSADLREVEAEIRGLELALSFIEL